MTHNIFPHRVHATHLYNWPQMPQLAKDIWMRIRPVYCVRWYAVDMEITGPTTLTLFVYDIADSVDGGIGDRILTIPITEFTEHEKGMLDEKVANLYYRAAECELEKREDDARTKKILKLRKEMFGV